VTVPGSFVRRAVTIPSGASLIYDEADWRDALVAVVEGVVELEGARGSRRTIAAGAVVWLAGIPLRALCNPGPRRAVLVAVRRQRPPVGDA
jgi:hypothetical protein